MEVYFMNLLTWFHGNRSFSEHCAVRIHKGNQEGRGTTQRKNKRSLISMRLAAKYSYLEFGKYWGLYELILALILSNGLVFAGTRQGSDVCYSTLHSQFPFEIPVSLGLLYLLSYKATFLPEVCILFPHQSSRYLHTLRMKLGKRLFR